MGRALIHGRVSLLYPGGKFLAPLIQPSHMVLFTVFTPVLLTGREARGCYLPGGSRAPSAAEGGRSEGQIIDRAVVLGTSTLWQSY